MDLTKILKVGDKVYSTIHGDAEVHKVENHKIFLKYIIRSAFNYAQLNTASPPTQSKIEDYSVVTNTGCVYEDRGECTIFPSKEERSWEKYCPLKKGDIAWFSHPGSDIKTLGIYLGREGEYYKVLSCKSDSRIPPYYLFENYESIKPEDYEKL